MSEVVKFPGMRITESAMTRPERIELLAKALCKAKHGNEDMWANYKAMAERLLSDEYEAVLRKVLQ